MNAVPEHQTFNISIFMVVTNYCTLAFSFIEIIVRVRGFFNLSGKKSIGNGQTRSVQRERVRTEPVLYQQETDPLRALSG
jgi:hypothetical protein